MSRRLDCDGLATVHGGPVVAVYYGRVLPARVCDKHGQLDPLPQPIFRAADQRNGYDKGDSD